MKKSYDLQIDPNAFLLSLHNKTGRQGCWLKNSMHPPYKKPRLPFGGKSATVHGLLKPLKTAHALMARQLVSMEETLRGVFDRCLFVYKAGIAYPDLLEEYAQGKRWFADGCPFPFVVEGLGFVDLDGRFFAYSFDLTPFSISECRADFHAVKGLDKSTFDMLGATAAFYNEYIELLFQKGYLVYPVAYTDKLFPLYRTVGLPKGVELLEI